MFGRLLLTASLAAIWAANGVDLREPLKPIVPADDQQIVFPGALVMVIIVLLNDESTWATPDTVLLRRSRRRTRVASLAMKSAFKRASGAKTVIKLQLGVDRRSTSSSPVIAFALPLRVRALLGGRWPCTIGSRLR